MKKILVLCVLIFIVGTCVAQSTNQLSTPYYDALILQQYLNKDGKIKIDSNNLKKILNILINYINKKDSVSATDIKKFFDPNALGKIDPNPFINIELSKLHAGSNENFIASGLNFNNIDNLNVTTIADGFAKFIVARTKQELSITFFERFQKDIDSIPQLQILFPSTFRALKVIGKEIYNYSAYMDLLRESFQRDLTLLLPNIKKLVDDKSMNIIFIKYPEIRTIFSDALFFVNELGDGRHPGEAIHGYLINQADSGSLEKINKYIYPSLEAFDLFSQSLRSKQEDHYWIGADSLKLLFDKETFQIYIGLIYQMLVQKIIYIDKANTLDSYLLKYKGKVDSLRYKFKPYLTELVDKGENVDTYFNALKQAQKNGKDKPSYQDYFSLFDASLDFFEHLKQGTSLFNINISETEEARIDDYFSTARSLGNIYLDVYQKQYTLAIVEFSGIYQNLLSGKVEEHLKEVNDSIKEKNDDKIKIRLQVNKNRIVKLSRFGKVVLKYGGFISAVVKAESSDDVQKVIESIALPAGSSRIKRETSFNVSLNAYCGLFGGQNRTKFWSKSEYSYGVTAPIGIACSWGIFKHSSLSIFASIIDLGAITAFRFTNDTTTTLSKIQLKDIISPGLFFSYGIPKCPISINAGCQITPLHTTVSATENSYAAKLFRFTVGICVDIPVLNFYTKPKEY